MSVPPKEETKQPTFQNQTVKAPGQKISRVLNLKKSSLITSKAQAIRDGINCFYSRRQTRIY